MGKSFMCVKVNTLTVVFYDIFKGSRIAFGIVWCEKMSDVSDAARFLVHLKGKQLLLIAREVTKALLIVWSGKMSDVSDAACFIVQLKGKCIYIVKRVKKSYSLSLSSLLV
jgi:16S rRNA C1402 (ribose-2'-O) methylase RsmI